MLSAIATPVFHIFKYFVTNMQQFTYFYRNECPTFMDCRIISFYLRPFLTKKNPALQDSPPAAGRLKRHLPFRRSEILPGRAFYVIGNSNGISYYIKNSPNNRTVQ